MSVLNPGNIALAAKAPSGDTPTEAALGEPMWPADPADTIARIQYLHDHPEIDIDNRDTDNILYGASNNDFEIIIEESTAQEDLRQRYQGETTWFPGAEGIWSPYNTLRSVVRALDLGEQDVLYDLGAGYGRLPLYAGIITAATCKGIELLDERVDIAQQAQDRLALDNVEVIAGNVLDQDYSDGSVFYMYLPFSNGTFKKVLSQLEDISADKPIRVVARGGETRYSLEPWLARVETDLDRAPSFGYEAAIFESR